jgi:hypothetical protein
MTARGHLFPGAPGATRGVKKPSAADEEGIGTLARKGGKGSPCLAKPADMIRAQEALRAQFSGAIAAERDPPPG